MIKLNFFNYLFMDCIFLTTEFPYNTGEQFIENEIDPILEENKADLGEKGVVNI